MTKYILVGGYPDKATDEGRAFCKELEPERKSKLVEYKIANPAPTVLAKIFPFIP